MQRSNLFRYLLAISALCLIPLGCDKKSDTTPTPPTPGNPNTTQQTGTQKSTGNESAAVYFVDRAKELGVNFTHTDGSSGKYFITETLASGVALFDYNNDGRLDIYFPNGRMLPPGSPAEGTVKQASSTHALFKQLENGKFQDVTQEAKVGGTGFGVGCCVADYDKDGLLDLYICQYGANLLYRNKGDGTFEDVTAKANVGDTGFGAGATFFDFDGDGDLDLYVTNYCIVDYATNKPCTENNVPGYCPPGHYKAAPDVLYRNEGDGTFKNVSQESGILAPTPGRGMGVIATDLNDDGKLDLYVANDGSENFLLENQGGGKFIDKALELGVALDANGDHQGSMGLDIADVDLDGIPEIVVTNYQKQSNTLYKRGRGGFYTDIAMSSKMAEKSLPWVGWGAGIIDFNDDGLPDIFIANGHLEDQIHRKDQSSDYLQPNQLLFNEGNGKFQDVTKSAGPGMQIVLSSRGSAFGDIDNDGDIDIVVCNSRSQPSVLLNESKKERVWLGLKLVSKNDKFAINTNVRIKTDKGVFLQEVRSGASYISQNDLRLRFALGEAKIQEIQITWPDGTKEVIEKLPMNSYSTVEQGKGQTQ